MLGQTTTTAHSHIRPLAQPTFTLCLVSWSVVRPWLEEPGVRDMRSRGAGVRRFGIPSSPGAARSVEPRGGYGGDNRRDDRLELSSATTEVGVGVETRGPPGDQHSPPSRFAAA
ncbi:hypothetical protein KQX54_006577 [Cotesia glomerata]|uniref:Uncharacterized protein n=1 Tax=Cotesia glomerata TaxID=32391 RepID=A0AAV7IXX5_COTGL|nr:hypothetical protein KQX54_006577 [Cotesia glomerata]